MRITHFGGIELPVYNVQDDGISTLVSAPLFLDLQDGSFDHYRTEDARRQPMTISRRCVVFGSTPIEVQDTIDALRAQVGTRNELYVTLYDGTRRWRMARLRRVGVRSRPGELTAREVELAWTADATPWQSELAWGIPTWVWDGGVAMNGANFYGEVSGFPTTSIEIGPGTTTSTITYAGNVPQTNIVFAVSAGSAALTALRLTITHVDENVTHSHLLVFTGTVAARKLLQIDCGARTVYNNSVAAYYYLDPPTNSPYWSVLYPGVNTITVYCEGGGYGGGMTIEYRDAYA